MAAGWPQDDGGLEAGRLRACPLGWLRGSGFRELIVSWIGGCVTAGCQLSGAPGRRRGRGPDGLLLAVIGGGVAECRRWGRSGVDAGCHYAGAARWLPRRGPNILLAARIVGGGAVGQRPAQVEGCRRRSGRDELHVALMGGGVAEELRRGGGGATVSWRRDGGPQERWGGVGGAAFIG